MTDWESRIKCIEDELSIRQLRARYCDLLDEGKADEVVDLFTEDGYFQGLGVAQGRESLRQFFSEQIPLMADDMWHFIGNETIDLDGDKARGRSSLQYWSSKQGESYLGVGHYEETFLRVENVWKFETKKVFLDFLTPVTEGWAGRPMHRPKDPKFLEMQAQNRAAVSSWMSKQEQ